MRRSKGREASVYEAVLGRVEETLRLMCFIVIRIQTWALEEARRRLEVEGILPDPQPKGEKK